MMNKVLAALVLALIIGLAGTVVVMSSTIMDVREEITLVREDHREHVKVAMYYMDQFNQMRDRFERVISSRIARQVEGIDGN